MHPYDALRPTPEQTARIRAGATLLAEPHTSSRSALCLYVDTVRVTSAFVRAGMLTTTVCTLPVGHTGPHK